jgi:hypothetical protein
LKQVTGHDQRNIQRYIIPVIADAVSPQFVLALRALMDFRYLAQSPLLDDRDCKRISNALTLFHQNKQAIMDADARRGKNGPICTGKFQSWNCFKVSCRISSRTGSPLSGQQILPNMPTFRLSKILLALGTISNMNPKFAGILIASKKYRFTEW